MTLGEIASILEVTVAGVEPGKALEQQIVAVCRDNRELVPGALFVCIEGERLDGHIFAAAAADAGAVALLCSRMLPEVALPQLVVPDTVRALGILAHAWRMRFGGKVVGVTGTAGKTTVKEVLAQVLSVRGKTARNAMNFNNQVGMPLSMLATDGDEDFWVMEAGISQPQDMEELAPVLAPDVALVLNVGAGHTQGLGEKGVAWHKSRLLTHVRPSGVGLICADYPDLVREARTACPDVQFFSTTGRPVTYRGAYNVPLASGRGSYRLWLNGQSLDVEAPFCGAYGAENAIAVAAAAHTLGLTSAEIAQGLAAATLPKQRFEMRSLGPWRIIDDTYNANPLSMMRMLEAAGDMAGGAPLYALLGAMGELGDVAADEHEKLGRRLAQSKIPLIFWKGPHADDVRTGLEAGNYSGAFHVVENAGHFVRCFAEARVKPGVMLCKGSRSNRLEELVNELTAWLADQEGKEEEGVKHVL